MIKKIAGFVLAAVFVCSISSAANWSKLGKSDIWKEEGGNTLWKDTILGNTEYDTITWQAIVDNLGAAASAADDDFDAIVDASGDGDAAANHYTTLQGAEDALDGSAYSVWVKNGTYAAGLTADSADNEWFFEPGTVVQAAVTFSGGSQYVNLMNACDIQGLLTMSGASVCVEAENGLDVDGIVMSGASGYFDGGGWGTLSDGGTTVAALAVSGDDCIIKNASFQTTSGATGESAIDVTTGDRNQLIQLMVIDAEESAIHIGTGSDDNLIQACIITDSDLSSILCNGLRTRILGVNIALSADHGIELGATGDNSTVSGCIIRPTTNAEIEIDTNCEDCVVVANRVMTIITDNSGTSTVSNNDVD